MALVLVDRDQIAAIMPACKRPGDWMGPLNAAMTRFDINSDVDYVAAFLAQVAVESGEMNRLDEALNYTAERLMQVWPKRFPTMASALPFARNPAGLANKVYANRLGNSDEASGDGWFYRGGGLIQVTGKNNYTRVDEGLGLKGELVKNPDMLRKDKSRAALSAAFFWGDPADRLSRLAQDLPDDDDDKDFVSITKVINGGTHGLAQRRVYWQRAKKALGS